MTLVDDHAGPRHSGTFPPLPNDPWLRDAPDAREVLAEVAALLGAELAFATPAELSGGGHAGRLRVLLAAEAYHVFWNWCTTEQAPAAAVHAMDLHKDFAAQVLWTYSEWGGEGAPPEGEMRTLYAMAAQCCDAHGGTCAACRMPARLHARPCRVPVLPRTR